MLIVSYATTAQSQFPMVVKYNTVSLRHKHSPETLIIHINQCIHIVLSFTGNARQSILHLKYCFQQKFYFFRKFFIILFYLILFYFSKKKFEIYCSQLTGQRLLFIDYCSQITIHGSLFTDYCRSLLLVTIQKLYCKTFSAAPCCFAIQ